MREEVFPQNSTAKTNEFDPKLWQFDGLTFCHHTAHSAAMGSTFVSSVGELCSARVAKLSRQEKATYVLLANGTRLLLPRFFASHVAIGDEITFPVPVEEEGAEVLIAKAGSPGGKTCIYLAPSQFATQPKTDKRDQSFVSAVIRNGMLGIASVVLPCGAIREYFYEIGDVSKGPGSDTFYKMLGTERGATPAEVRVAFKLRKLELDAAGALGAEQRKLERAFNILGHPELRAHYDSLLANPETPALFPYGGAGSLLVSGERSRNGETFFARRILTFVPEQLRRQFHVRLRDCEFYSDKALYRDPRRKLQFWLDPSLTQFSWDPSWNRWKPLLSAKIEVEGAFVKTPKFENRNGNWECIDWQSTLPSRLSVKVPDNFQQHIERARNTYCQFGQYSHALDQIRLCLEHKGLEIKELRRICSDLGIPSAFDIAQINWRPDYEPFFYAELSRRSRGIYLFRSEYIFDCEKAVVIETPQLGHATYLFAKPRSMENFLSIYSKTSKAQIRRNRDNVGERLGFLARVVHGTNHKAWIKEIRIRLGDDVR